MFRFDPDGPEFYSEQRAAEYAESRMQFGGSDATPDQTSDAETLQVTPYNSARALYAAAMRLGG